MSKKPNQLTPEKNISMNAEEKNIAAVITAFINGFSKKGAKTNGLTKEEAEKIISERESHARVFIKAFEKSEVLKTLLAAQMYEVHDQHEKMANRANSSNFPQHRQMYINSLVKLSNVFIQQTILMQKLTGNGQQKVIVEHVHVHNGGQAIVGNIENTRGGASHEEK